RAKQSSNKSGRILPKDGMDSLPFAEVTTKTASDRVPELSLTNQTLEAIRPFGRFDQVVRALAGLDQR
ncbi:MAG: hypothetical protein KDA90_23935, partial [Planctomycetaceae bacterium]|nr:hypothetical protein [Planctomycetaceae bacterium]